MNEAVFVTLLQRGLLLCLWGVLPPLLLAALFGGLVDFVQGRLGIAEPAPPTLARLLAGFVTLLLCAPWLGGEVARFATALWASLPALGR